MRNAETRLGLGKTFIAATVMLNWFRWAPEGQIAFLAPTKPLVNQQIDACFNIAGIPRSQTAIMTGGVQKALRQEYWDERRVFFLTPQTMQNDIKNGLCDPKRIVCLVIDEAHRATGEYSYVQVVREIRKTNPNFRLLALTATPGSKVETVQSVIDALGIARIEIRTDESLDIRQYVKKRHLDVQVFQLTPEMIELRDLYCECLTPMLKKLNAANAFFQTRAENLTSFGVLDARRQWQNSPAAQRMGGAKWGLIKIFGHLASLSHALKLLTTHGVRLFYDKLINARDDPVRDDEEVVAKTSVDAIRKEKAFPKLLERSRALVTDPAFPGHPKNDFMVGAILRHFAEAEDEEIKKSTRIMVFTGFRDSAEEVTRILARHSPMIRPHAFVGQAGARNSAGMSQKQQLEIIKDFQEGKYNVLISTSIGEEGLDIGEVDLIVCYDTTASPIRLIQRMGRTGRKRVGGVLVLLTEGREQESYRKALDNAVVMQRKIASGQDFTFPVDLSPRILPREIEPVPDKVHIEIPPENSQAEPERKKARVTKKAPPKKFFMPAGVRTGFTKASKFREGNELTSDSEGPDVEEDGPYEEPLAPEITTSDHLLNEEEEVHLQRLYMTNWQADGGTEDHTVVCPRLHLYPGTQRSLTRTKYVKHGRWTKKTVKMLQRMHNMDLAQIERFKKHQDYDPESPKKTTAFKPVKPTAAKKLAPARNQTASLKAKTNIPISDEDIEIMEIKKPARNSRKKAVASKKRAATPQDNSDEEVFKRIDSTKRRKRSISFSSDIEFTEIKKPTAPAPTKKTAVGSKKRAAATSADTSDGEPAPDSGKRRKESKQQSVTISSSPDDGMEDSDEFPSPRKLLAGFKFIGGKRK